MRTIKFRVWDKTNKKIIKLNWSIINLGFVDKDNRRVCVTPKSPFYKFMQFTGLKDKNGKEIYEGDVIIINYGATEKEEHRYEGEVFYNDAGYWVKTKIVGYNKVSLTDGADLEIIGNIHENKNLQK